MKALITASGQYGPFTSITQTADRWICDGAEYQFSVIGDATIGEYTPPPPPPPTVEQLKAQRESAVAAIKVTTAAGHTYDGDEVSINRMTAAITVLTATGGSVPWVLADNSIVSVNAAELTEALALAAAEVARLWVMPYQP